MMIALLLLQAVSTPVSAEAREQYEPFRQCLIERARSLAPGGLTGEALLDQARSRCLSANLASGSAALLAEVRSGATEEQAVERIAALREATEQEALAAALSVAQPPEPQAGTKPAPLTTVRVQRQETLTIPDEVAPAVLPYLDCLYGSRGIEIRSPDGTPQPAAVPRGTDCTAHRRAAADRADRLLRNRSMGTTSRRAEYVERVLANIDRFAGSLPASPEAQAATDKPADPLPSIDIPYQILPAFRTYSACVGGHFQANPRSTSADDAEIRQANADAVAACSAVRETQLARALELLTDFRPFAGDRERARGAARLAFDRFDRDFIIEPSGSALTSNQN